MSNSSSLIKWISWIQNHVLTCLVLCISGISQPFPPYILILTLSQMTNFKHFWTERDCRRQFQIWWKWQKILQMCRKTLWEKEKLLVTSNFSFYDSVFKILVLQTCKSQGLFGNGLTHWKKKSFRKTLKLAISIFSRMLSMQSVYISIYFCSVFKIWTVLKWCKREWVNPLPDEKF